MSVAQEAVNFLADLHEGNNKEYLRATFAEQDKVFNLLRNPDLKEREAEWKEALTGQGGFLLNGLAPNGPRRRTVDDIIDLARVEAGIMETRPYAFHLVEEIQKTSQNHKTSSA